MLTREQIEALDDKGLLAKIAEEASEIIQAAMKHHAHGPRPFWNGKQYNNVIDTRTEFGQLQSLMDDHERRFGWR